MFLTKRPINLPALKKNEYLWHMATQMKTENFWTGKIWKKSSKRKKSQAASLESALTQHGSWATEGHLSCNRTILPQPNSLSLPCRSTFFLQTLWPPCFLYCRSEQVAAPHLARDADLLTALAPKDQPDDLWHGQPLPSVSLGGVNMLTHLKRVQKIYWKNTPLK